MLFRGATPIPSHGGRESGWIIKYCACIWGIPVLEYTLRFVTTRGVLKAAYTEVSEMKEGIHPKYYKTTIRCACGNVIETGSTRENITVEICSKCHPFYTGKQKLVDTSGRVDKFNKKYGIK